MNYITDTEKLKGKVIKSAKFVDGDESLAIIFADNTCVYLDVKHYGDSYEMYLAEDACSSDEREAGIISEIEYELSQLRERKERVAKIENSERAQLEKLKAKYAN
jgi:hypothetical protein